MIKRYSRLQATSYWRRRREDGLREAAGEGEGLRPCLPVAWWPGWVRGVALVDLGWAVEGNNWNLGWLDLDRKCGIY